jgi:hypothetical protein
MLRIVVSFKRDDGNRQMILSIVKRMHSKTSFDKNTWSYTHPYCRDTRNEKFTSSLGFVIAFSLLRLSVYLLQVDALSSVKLLYEATEIAKFR